MVGDGGDGIDRSRSDSVIAGSDRRAVLARFGLKRVGVASKIKNGPTQVDKRHAAASRSEQRDRG